MKAREHRLESPLKTDMSCRGYEAREHLSRQDRSIALKSVLYACHIPLWEMGSSEARSQDNRSQDKKSKLGYPSNAVFLSVSDLYSATSYRF